MIEHELLSEDLVEAADHEEGVRRIVGVYDIESLSHGDVNAHEKTRASEVDVFGQ